MNKPILIPLIATSLLMGCQKEQHSQTQQNQVELTDTATQAQAMQWVGHYQGTTPCMGCMYRCEDCPGMAVDLVLHPNMTYELKRESLSTESGIETFTGQLRFIDYAQTKIELMNVKQRNLIQLDVNHLVLEILEDRTAEHYQAYPDFTLDWTDPKA
jgi:hypothetical protein